MHPWCKILSFSLGYTPFLNPEAAPLTRQQATARPPSALYGLLPLLPPLAVPQWCTAQRCAAAGRCPAWSSAHGRALPSAPVRRLAAARLTRCGLWSCCGGSCCWRRLSPCGRGGEEGRALHVRSDRGAGAFLFWTRWMGISWVTQVTAIYQTPAESQAPSA